MDSEPQILSTITKSQGLELKDSKSNKMSRWRTELFFFFFFITDSEFSIIDHQNNLIISLSSSLADNRSIISDAGYHFKEEIFILDTFARYIIRHVYNKKPKYPMKQKCKWLLLCSHIWTQTPSGGGVWHATFCRYILIFATATLNFKRDNYLYKIYPLKGTKLISTLKMGQYTEKPTLKRDPKCQEPYRWGLSISIRQYIQSAKITSSIESWCDKHLQRLFHWRFEAHFYRRFS